jgi:hypothetical protein
MYRHIQCHYFAIDCLFAYWELLSGAYDAMGKTQQALCRQDAGLNVRKQANMATIKPMDNDFLA